MLNGATGTEDHLWSTGYKVIGNAFATGTDYDLSHALGPGASRTFVIDWELPSDTGREAQSDVVELVLTFQLGQTAGQ